MPSHKTSIFDVRHPFFRPLWRRVALTGLCLVWALFELTSGAKVWAVVFGGFGVVLFVQFFVKFDAADYAQSPDNDRSDDL